MPDGHPWPFVDQFSREQIMVDPAIVHLTRGNRVKAVPNSSKLEKAAPIRKALKELDHATAEENPSPDQ